MREPPGAILCAPLAEVVLLSSACTPDRPGCTVVVRDRVRRRVVTRGESHAHQATHMSTWQLLRMLPLTEQPCGGASPGVPAGMP